MQMPPTVTKTDIRCPRADEHKTEKNIVLLERPDGTRFCPLHGDVKAYPPYLDVESNERSKTMDVGREIGEAFAKIQADKEYDRALERYRKALKAAQDSPAAPLPCDPEVMREYEEATEALAKFREDVDA